MSNLDKMLTPTARTNGLVVQELNEELLVYDTYSNRDHCLNQSAAFVWKLCDGSRTARHIASQFEPGGLGKVTEDFVWLALDQLNENGLLENKQLPRFSGRSRREVLETIGMASVVAIPIIASLAVPNTVFAVVSDCPCTSDSICGAPQNANCASTTHCNNLGLCAPDVPSRYGRKVG